MCTNSTTTDSSSNQSEIQNFVLSLALCSSIEIFLFRLINSRESQTQNPLLRVALADSNLIIDANDLEASKVGVCLLAAAFLAIRIKSEKFAVARVLIPA